MFILSYFKKKQTNTIKKDTIENLDDDFLVITDKSFSPYNHKCLTSDPDDKKNEENVKNIDIVDEDKINNNSIEYVNQKNNDINYDISFSDSCQGSLFETSSSLRSQRRDEENQLIENTKNVHKKISFCDKIMNTLRTVSQILFYHK